MNGSLYVSGGHYGPRRRCGMLDLPRGALPPLELCVVTPHRHEKLFTPQKSV